jgi:hypothetical protein
MPESAGRSSELAPPPPPQASVSPPGSKLGGHTLSCGKGVEGVTYGTNPLALLGPIQSHYQCRFYAHWKAFKRPVRDSFL